MEAPDDGPSTAHEVPDAREPMLTRRRRHLPLALTLGLIVAGCASGGATPDTVAPSSSAPSMAPSAAPPATPAPSGSPSAEPASPAPPTVGPTATPPAITASWAQVELTDVATGATFRIADLAGKTVILETMAIWCTKCFAQQGDVYAALEQLDPERLAYVLLDVDPNESADALAEYRRRNGFEGTYAIADRDLARALAAEFGDQILNPPSTPMVLIGSDGGITLTPFGPKSPDDVIRLARDHGA
jgi:thiol-disulfide isomerase/thioredoxin